MYQYFNSFLKKYSYCTRICMYTYTACILCLLHPLYSIGVRSTVHQSTSFHTVSRCMHTAVTQYSTMQQRTYVLQSCGCGAAVGRIWKRRLQSAEILGWIMDMGATTLLPSRESFTFTCMHAASQRVRIVRTVHVRSSTGCSINAEYSYILSYSIYGVMKLKRDGFGKAELRRSYLGWSKSRMSMHARRPARPMVQHNINIQYSSNGPIDPTNYSCYQGQII